MANWPKVVAVGIQGCHSCVLEIESKECAVGWRYVGLIEGNCSILVLSSQLTVQTLFPQVERTRTQEHVWTNENRVVLVMIKVSQLQSMGNNGKSVVFQAMYLKRVSIWIRKGGLLPELQGTLTFGEERREEERRREGRGGEGKRGEDEGAEARKA